MTHKLGDTALFTHKAVTLQSSREGYNKHSGMRVTLIANFTSYPVAGRYKIEAEDGWRGFAFEEELSEWQSSEK